jgi:putative DNA primase/helicase
MSYINYDEVLSTLISHDFIISSLDIGTMRRVKRDNSKQKGWYVLHDITLDDGRTALIGSFGYFIGAEKFSEKLSPGADVKLNSDQLAAIKKQHAEATKKAQLQRDADAEKASKMATNAWYKYVAEGESSYLIRKSVQSHGLKFAPSGNGTLAIPIKDVKGKVWGLQIIRGKDRGNKLEKEYWPKGVNKKAHFHTLGSINTHTQIALIAEGYATAASLHQATGLTVFVAFDAGNLEPVASAIHKEYPRCKLLVCADDDYLTEGNPGVKAAQNAAIAVGGAYLAPDFVIDREGKKLTDFNDLANFPNCSESTIRVQIEDKIKALAWVSEVQRASETRAPALIQGGGDERNTKLKALLSVEEAVERYSLIYGADGTMYDHQEFALIKKSDVLDICTDHAWREWKLHPMRNVVRLSEVGFDPTEKDRNITCNLWGGFPTIPKQGHCGILLSLLERLCSDEENGKPSDKTIYQWVLKWLAYPIQHHGAKMRTALIFHGAQGTGKNLFFEAYAKIFGRYGRIIGQAEIDDKFNDWASGKLFMIADEVVARQELFHIKNKIKALSTGDSIRINPKNVAAHDERNHVNIVFLSNEKQPLVLEKDDRRFAVIWTPSKGHENYYADVAEEIAAGGVKALHDYLLNLDLGDFNEHSKPPMTQSKQDLIDINLDSSEQFMDEYLAGELDLPVCPCLSESFYEAYAHWCKRNGVFKPRELRQFVGIILKTNGWERKKPMLYEDYNFMGTPKLQRRVIYPPPQNYHDKHKKQADQTEAKWVSGCVLDFKEALNKKKDRAVDA